MATSTDVGICGFIGLGLMGLGMAKNLLNKRKHHLIIWNRDTSKSDDLATEFPGRVTVASTPKEVVATAQVTFTMLSTLEASAAVFEGPDGVLAGVGPTTSIVDCATLTPERMAEMAVQVEEKGAIFLEAPVSGSKAPAEQGTLIFMCAGDKGLYERVSEDLDAMGKARYFLGTVGAASRMKIVVNMTMGGMLACFAEGLGLAEAADLPLDDLLAILDGGACACPMFKLKGPKMLQRKYDTAFPLKHAQKDMRFAVELGDKLAQPLPVAAAANEVYKRARRQGHDDDDFSAVAEACMPPQVGKGKGEGANGDAGGVNGKSERS